MLEISVKTTQKEEFIEITPRIREAIAKKGYQSGICIVYIPHTTAGVTINENADPSVRHDIIYTLGRVIPPDWEYHHVEGNADAHVKASLVGSSVVLVVENGSLRLGTWQGVFFCEFDGPRSRHFWLQFMPS